MKLSSCVSRQMNHLVDYQIEVEVNKGNFTSAVSEFGARMVWINNSLFE